MILVLQYRLKLRYDKKRHQEKIEKILKFANDKGLGIQFKTFENPKGKDEILVNVQIKRKKEQQLREWEKTLKEKIRKTFYRVPYENVNLIENKEVDVKVEPRNNRGYVS